MHTLSTRYFSTNTQTQTATNATKGTGLLGETLKKATSIEQPSEEKKKKKKNTKKEEKDKEKQAWACRYDMNGSPYKIAKLANQIRGLSYSEALTQLQFSPKHHGLILKKLIVQARYTAENMHSMNPERLLIGDIVVNKAKYLRKIRFHAKMRAGISHKPRTHLKVMLKEVPFVEGERIFGKFGRTAEAIEREQIRLQKDISILPNY